MALNHKRKVMAAAGIAALSLTTAACGSSSNNDPGAQASADTTDYSKWCDMKSELNGKTVSIYTSIVTPEDASHKASYKAFEDCTGVKVNYEGDKDFEKNLPQRAQSGNLPDVAFIPQPGLLQTMVDTGKAIPASKTVGDEVDKYFGKDWRKYGSVDGTLYAAPLGANVKSFVWYSPKTFKAKGYTVPTTWDELMTLTAKIAADDPGAKPWCAGFGSGTATGWVGTDWVEDVLLRTAGPDVYDQWVAHKVKFNDPKVADALAKVGAILKDPKYTNGGFGAPSTIATTTFQDGGQPILKNKCYMHRQASFYASNWPEGTKVAEDGDVWAFYLPSVDTSTKPVLGGGEFVATFRDAPEVKAFAGVPRVARLGQREGQGHDQRRLGQRQQGPGRRQPGLADRPAERQDPPGPRCGLPLRRVRPDAERRGRGHLLVGDDQLGQGSGRQDHAGQHREVLAGQLSLSL